MRGSALAGPFARILVGTVMVSVLVACNAASPPASPSAGASVDVTITTGIGQPTRFDPAEIEVVAAGPISITFRNGSSLPHNLTFTGVITAATRTIVEPGTFDELRLSSLAAGAYPFVCTIHDGMAGTLTVRTK